MTNEEITPYLDEHRPDQQEYINGVPINPNLRSDFDVTPNGERDPSEVSDWWGRPFIVTESWDDNTESWEDFSERLKQSPLVDPGTREDFEIQQQKFKESWFGSFPSGVRYEVLCLDGGAWDRATVWGMVGSLEEAMEIIKERSS